MSVGTIQPLSPLGDALRTVQVAEDRTSVLLGEREVTSESPRELRRLLAEAIYEVLHAGQNVEKGSISYRLREEPFEEELAAAVPHRETTVRVRWCGESREIAEGRRAVLVEREGVRVWAAEERLVDPGEPAVGDVVALRVAAQRPALSPGFFLVDSSLMQPQRQEVLRVYVHITEWQAAAGVFRRVLNLLEGRGAPYRSKVLSSKALYPRRDALVVYLDRPWWSLATEIADAVDGLPGIGAETSIFAERLAPGVAIACEPDDQRPGMRGLSFGQHRATALATALLDSDENVAEAIRTAFETAGIDPERPGRNLNSTEIPTVAVH
ncbi:MAG TPA: T3SS effector HopA1 family protein [Micromonospora sp.]|nr:T3SS effector HopA1 family protein [Micromonospora sp.]